MSRLEDRGWPDSVDWLNRLALEKAATNTNRFTNYFRHFRGASTADKNTQLAKIIQDGETSLRKSITRRHGERSEYKLDLNKAADAFLGIATDIEALLMDLLVDKNKELDTVREEEILSSKMGLMALASAVE